MKEWGQWFRDQYDKHLLLLLFAGCLGFAIYTQNLHMDEGSVDWARSKADQVLGGLMTLIAGKLWNERKSALDTKTDTIAVVHEVSPAVAPAEVVKPPSTSKEGL